MTTLAPYAQSFPELAKKYPPLPMAALPKEPGVLKVETEAQTRERLRKEALREAHWVWPMKSAETTAQQRIKQWRKG